MRMAAIKRPMIKPITPPTIADTLTPVAEIYNT